MAKQQKVSYNYISTPKKLFRWILDMELASTLTFLINEHSYHKNVKKDVTADDYFEITIGEICYFLDIKYREKIRCILDTLFRLELIEIYYRGDNKKASLIKINYDIITKYEAIPDRDIVYVKRITAISRKKNEKISYLEYPRKKIELVFNRSKMLEK